MNQKNLGNQLKNSIIKQKKLIVFVGIFLHLTGLLVAFFQRKNQLPFHLPLHLLRFFTWWSVHTSLLSVFALITLLGEEKNKKTSWFSQFILLSAALFSLVTFLFCLTHLLGGALKGNNSLFLNLNSFTGHFICPPLTVFCFYSWGKINLLRKKLLRSLLCSYIGPFLYFIYVYLLSWLNDLPQISKSKIIGLYLKKYPYQVFQFLAQNSALLGLVGLPVALGVVFGLFWLLLGTKILIEKKISQKNKGNF